MTRLTFALLLAALCACHSSSNDTPVPAASASAAPPPTWVSDAHEIWGSGEEPTPLNLTAFDEGRALDGGRPTDKVVKTVIFTGRLPEDGDALPPAVADHILKTMRIKTAGAPDAVIFRLFRDDIAPDAAMGTIVIVNDPAAPVNWAMTQPKDLGKILPELTRPTMQKTSIALTRSFAHSWRAWLTSYAETWDGQKLDEAAVIAMCERAIALDMAPGSTIPDAASRGKDCKAPKMGTTITWSCFTTWETKKGRYDCALNATKAPTITILDR